MSTSSEKTSAQIIQFPAGGRAGRKALGDAARRAAAEAEAVTAPKIAVGGSWYHDEAIEDAKKP